MKNLFVWLVLGLWAGFSNAQEITELKEARIGFAPFEWETTNNQNTFRFSPVESHVGEFENDPIAYLDEYCDMELLASVLEDKKYSIYTLNVVSTKGNLDADFNKKGELIKTNFKLKNVLLPAELREQICKEYEGWTMVENIHVARIRNGRDVKEFYHIKLEKGNQSKILKIDVSDSRETDLVNI